MPVEMMLTVKLNRGEWEMKYQTEQKYKSKQKCDEKVYFIFSVTQDQSYLISRYCDDLRASVMNMHVVKNMYFKILIIV